MIQRIIYVILLASFANCFSQQVDKKKIVEKIKNKSALFLIAKGEIESVEGLNSKISIIEILDNKILGFNTIGIYRLYAHKSPSFTYILLKDKSHVKIIDLKKFSESFPKIIKFIKNTDFADEKKVLYLEKIIEVYNNNNYAEKIKF